MACSADPVLYHGTGLSYVIQPGFRFQVVEGLSRIHLPRSSLLLLGALALVASAALISMPKSITAGLRFFPMAMRWILPAPLRPRQTRCSSQRKRLAGDQKKKPPTSGATKTGVETMLRGNTGIAVWIRRRPGWRPRKSQIDQLVEEVVM